MVYDKEAIQKLSKVLTENILNWDSVTFHFEKQNYNSIWSAHYTLNSIDSESAEKHNLNITPILLDNLKKLENSPIFPKISCDVEFFRNGKYKIKSSDSAVFSDHIDLNLIRKKIKIIKNLDLLTESIDEIKKHIGLLSKGYIQITPIIPKGSKLFRGVIWNDKPKYISQISYPPKKNVKTLHRAGRQGQSLFYCSTARESSFWELGVKAKECLVISHWETTEPLLVNNVGYHPDVFSSLSSIRACPDWQNDNEIKKQSPANKIIKEFFSKEFARKIVDDREYLYKISIAIAEHHFQQNIFAGLLYPTLALKANTDNLVLKPDIVEKYLRLLKVEYVLVEEVINNDKFKIQIKDFANSFDLDGLIHWKGRLPQWVLREKGTRLVFTVENNQWIAKNEKGEVIESE
ncbi:MAG: hypothetical protein P9L97_11650 [Candidatus Tenebribacter davisii]|nr:hypothetical protein [Candidatus Tenebribacter davisii]